MAGRQVSKIVKDVSYGFMLQVELIHNCLRHFVFHFRLETLVGVDTFKELKESFLVVGMDRVRLEKQRETSTICHHCEVTVQGDGFTQIVSGDL